MSKSLFGWKTGLAALAFAAAAVAGVATSATSAQTKAATAAKAQIGVAAPTFTLTDINGKTHSLAEYTEQGKIVVLEWFNPMCPYVVKHHETVTTMADTYNAFKDKNVVWLAINSSHQGNMAHGKDAEFAKKWNIGYPVLNDESGMVGRMYAAKTTPHMFIIDSNGVLVYDGAIDNDPGHSPKTDGSVVNYVHQALSEVVKGETVTESKTKPYGCSVKYAG